MISSYLSKIESRQLWELLAACHRTKSLTQACRQVNISVSAASKLISSFETSAQIDLLDRSTRPAQFTKNLELLIPSAHKMLASFEEAQKVIGILKNEQAAKKIGAQTVKIALPINVRNSQLLCNLLEYARNTTGLRLEFYGDDCFKRLMRDEVDIAQFGFHPQSSELKAEYIRTNAFFILASKGFIKKYGMPNSIEELEKFPIVIRNPTNRSFSRRLENGGKTYFLPESSNVIYADTTTCVALLLAGEAISIDVSISSVLEQLKTREVVPVLDGWHRKPNDTYVCCHIKKAHDPIISDLMNIIKRTLRASEEDSWWRWAAEFGINPDVVKSQL